MAMPITVYSTGVDMMNLNPVAKSLRTVVPPEGGCGSKPLMSNREKDTKQVKAGIQEERGSQTRQLYEPPPIAGPRICPVWLTRV